jgi:hypothetical protein
MNTSARRLPAIVLACLALVLSAQFANAQTSSSAPGGAGKIQVNVNAVLVPVVVRDAHGIAVGTLKREDFQLLDRGKPQGISGFTIEKRARMESKSDLSEHSHAVPGASTSALSPQANAVPQRFVVFLFEGLKLQARRGYFAARAADKRN